MWTSLKRNLGKIIGGFGGFLIALLLIFAWPLVLIIFLVVMGVFLGGIFDAGRRIRDFFDRIFSQEKSQKDEDGTG
ncbi:MAG: DUF2273 domain-containing protein [bacterium]